MRLQHYKWKFKLIRLKIYLIIQLLVANYLRYLVFANNFK